MPTKHKRRQWLWRFPRVGAAVYFAMLVIVWAVCDKLLFPVQPPAYRLDDPGILAIPFKDGQTLPALWLPRDGARWNVLYLHANAEDVGAVRAAMEEWRERFGVGVLAVEYPGYGRATGSPSEDGCHAAVRTGYAYLRETLRTPPERILVYGRSLGGGVAVELASNREIGALVLESTFLSAFRTKTGIRVFPFDRFNSYAKIGAVRCPLLVIHGDADRVIPFYHGKWLFEAAKSAREKRFVAVPGAGHNDVPQRGGSLYWNAIADLIGFPADFGEGQFGVRGQRTQRIRHRVVMPGLRP